MIYVYTCSAYFCEDRQNKFCGYTYKCPFCGEGFMTLNEDQLQEIAEEEMGY